MRHSSAARSSRKGGTGSVAKPFTRADQALLRLVDVDTIGGMPTEPTVTVQIDQVTVKATAAFLDAAERAAEAEARRVLGEGVDVVKVDDHVHGTSSRARESSHTAEQTWRRFDATARVEEV